MADRRNWLHLDCKGAMPSLPRLLEWLDWLAEQGFDGIVWEYENRFPWAAWPGTFEPGYSFNDWRQIWGRCRRLGLAIAPLVQTLGHLEWLLKHDAYSHLSETDQRNAICPQHPDSMPMLTGWLDEVMDLHEDSEFVHLGADEVWNLASCPKCRSFAEQSPEGPMGVYLQHVGGLCEHVVARGKRPMIWADMFKDHSASWSAQLLPEQTVLIDWSYAPVPVHSLEALKSTGREVWGGSAIRCGFEQKYALAPIGDRLANISKWRHELENGAVDTLMHTTWARGDSLRPVYGPWDGWLPGFIAAGDPSKWNDHVLGGLVGPLDKALVAPESTHLADTIDRVESTSSDDPTVKHCLRWWALALRHRQLFWATVEHTIGYLGMEACTPHRGLPDKFLQLLRGETDSDLPFGPVRETFGDLAHANGLLDNWERDARAFWRDRELSDVDEYFGSRVGNLRQTLARVRQQP